MKTNSQGKADESDKEGPYLDLDPYDLQMGGYGGDETESPATIADMNNIKRLIEETKRIGSLPAKRGYKKNPNGSYTFTNDR